MVNDSELVLIY